MASKHLSKDIGVRPAPSDSSPLQQARRHSLAEDAYAFAIGSSFIVIGLTLLKHAGLVTGGIAGVALLLSYLIHMPVGLMFMAINIPFFLYAGVALGRPFMFKTVIVNLLIMAMGVGAPFVITLSFVDPLFAALFGGTIIGFGILALARHAAGVGGSGVVALAMQQKRGWNAGRTQMIGDAVILSASLPVISADKFLLSVLSAAAINAVLFVNHRPGRYTGY